MLGSKAVGATPFLSKSNLLPDQFERRAGEEDEAGRLDDELFKDVEYVAHTISCPAARNCRFYPKTDSSIHVAPAGGLNQKQNISKKFVVCRSFLRVCVVFSFGCF